MRADYGYFAPASPAWSDITGKVKSQVASGVYVIPANNDFAGDDPAPNIPKRLRVEYNLNGGDTTLEVKEGESLTLPQSATVIQALYGDLDKTNRVVDVTEKLASRVDHGRLSVGAGNALAGSDPAELVPKELRVDYLLDGVAKHIAVQENDTLVLPPGVSIGQAPQFEVLATAGDSAVSLRANGSVELTAADGKLLRADATDVPAPHAIGGPWDLSFPPNWGAPPSVTLDKLSSWTENANDGVRYFSGTATYEKK